MKDLFRWVIVATVAAIALYFILANSSCQKHEEEETVQQTTLAYEMQKRDQYCQAVDDRIYLARCDKLTFKSLTAAFCPNRDIDLSTLEWARDGQWYRDEQSCLADLDGNGNPDSKSECSPDGYIGLAHYWISEGPSALPQVNRTIEFLRSNNWICGEGDRKVTAVGHLQPLLLSVQAYLSGGSDGLYLLGGSINLNGLIPTHNKYLGAMAVYAKGRMEGEINSIEKKALKDWYDGQPGSCVFAGLYHRYHDGDQSTALQAMTAFGENIQYEDGYGGWGSFPYSTAQILCTGILEGL